MGWPMYETSACVVDSKPMVCDAVYRQADQKHLQCVIMPLSNTLVCRYANRSHQIYDYHT